MKSYFAAVAIFSTLCYQGSAKLTQASDIALTVNQLFSAFYEHPIFESTSGDKQDLELDSANGHLVEARRWGRHARRWIKHARRHRRPKGFLEEVFVPVPNHGTLSTDGVVEFELESSDDHLVERSKRWGKLARRWRRHARRQRKPRGRKPRGRKPKASNDLIE